MGWSERGKREMQGMLLPVIVCVCFIASSLLFLVQMIVKSEEENITDLYNAANQTKTALLKQIEGDWQTLEGLSVSLQSLANIRTDELMEILADVNDKNAFIRMGYADASGQGEMVDLAGNIETISIAKAAFFQRAMEGEKSISMTFEDSNSAGGYVNYFATRVLNSDGETEGVLCAVPVSYTHLGEKEERSLLIVESAGLCNRCAPHLKGCLAVCVIDNLSGINTPCLLYTSRCV